MRQIQTVFIYQLLDPDTNKIRYVGQTRNVQRRTIGHYSDARNMGKAQRTPKDEWIFSLLSQGKKPVMQIHKECSEIEANSEEELLIKRLLKNGVELLNIQLNDNFTPSESNARLVWSVAKISDTENHVIDPQGVLAATVYGINEEQTHERAWRTLKALERLANTELMRTIKNIH